MDEHPGAMTDSPESLRKDPTTFGWMVELQRILSGERERSLLQLQSVAAYINKVLARSDDEALARTCFQDALKQIVQTWQPTERFSKEYLACMLDLISAYMPLEGAAKVLGLLRRWGTFSEEIKSSGGYGAESDLSLQALVALESYFPLSPHHKLKEQSRIFQDYVDTLLNYLAAARYGGYVASRLIELGMIQVEDQRIGELIRIDPTALYELLSLFFAPNRQARLGANLRVLASHVVNSTDQTRNLFDEGLQIYGARLVPVPSGLQIILKDQSKIVVPSERDLKKDVKLSTYPVGPESFQQAWLNDQIYQLSSFLKREDEEARKHVWLIFEHCLVGGSSWIELFAAKFEQNGGRFEHDESGVRLVLAGGVPYDGQLTHDAELGYVVWNMRRSKVPHKRTMIRELTATASAT